MRADLNRLRLGVKMPRSKSLICFRIIDIPGERRTIKRIDFKYKSINRRKGKATVEVLGL